ncbi:hypothetical protein ONZ51_g9795 [Trametes cubensis]|uniref:Uncharacterized protein n=1 Tax=Trametes cubensis TaxID=1111947 RepID=A0AAD7TLV4_9APHY|nr:hypothetical protein ONZ51_g9795 [Trametes cubensis]
MSDAPSWPSLYNPLIELFPLQHRDPIQPSGRYLHDPHDVFRFTLYWTLIFYTPSHIICGTYALLNLAFPPPRAPHKTHKRNGSRTNTNGAESIPLRRFTDRQLSTGLGSDAQSQLRLPSRSPPAKQNERRSRLTFAILVFIVFATLAVAGAVVGSAIIGYVLAGLFKAAKYNMSTWIPFIGGLLQTLVGFLGLWPTVVDII